MSASKQTAEPAGNKLKSDTIEIAALGRPFQLGMLYDCRNDALIPGITLWDHENLQKGTSVNQQHNTEFNVTTSDSIEEKSNSLNISGSLKLSLLGGLVNVGGSAKYFQDTKKSHKQARVTLQYRTTTTFESLTMTHLAHGQISHPSVFEDGIATHVVTAILYGAGAYFLFDRESSSEDKREQVEGEANLTFSKLKYLTVDAEASLNMDDEEKAAVEKFSCTFHGDFQLKTNPTSFSDAMSVYRNLPQMLENGEYAVPLRVWLYPLVKLDSRAEKLQRVISNDLIAYSSETIESLTMTEMRCSDILKDTAAATLPAMGEKVQILMQRCRQYKLDFMQKLGSVLPSIRGGGKEESALADILKAHEQSPFNSNDLDQWLTRKEKESDTLKSFLNQLKEQGAKMDDNLDDLLSDLAVKTVVCFSFTSVDQPDSFLVKLKDYLKPPGMVATPAESSDLQARNTEWLTNYVRQTMRRQLKIFRELKKFNNSDDTKFIAASTYDESHPGAQILIYEDGCSDAVPFVPPSKPATPTTTGVTHDSLTVKVSETDSATVEYRVEYRMKQEQETEWASHPVQKNQEAVTLSGLMAGTEYEIRATAVGKLGYAVSSDVYSALTLPDMRDTTKMLMQPNANWEEYLTPAPLSIAIMGELVFISSGTDFSINKNPPPTGFKYIKYPDSFRACLMQICKSVSHAFNEAHKNMDQIRIHTATVPNHMEAAVKNLFQGSDEVIETLLPNQLENIRTIADECVTLAEGVEIKYSDVINLIQELLEACVNAAHFYGEELEEVNRKLRGAHKKMEKNQNKLTDDLVEMQNCRIKKIDFDTTVRMLVKGLDAMGKVKEQWEKMVRFFQMVSTLMKASLSKTLHNFATTANDTKKLSYNEKLFAKDLLYNQAFQASNIASLVHMISGTYTEVSTVSSLDKIMAMDKSKPEFLQERLNLQESCQAAQDSILQLVLKNKKEFERKTNARMAKIEGELKAILPAASPQETERIKERVQAGFDDEELDHLC